MMLSFMKRELSRRTEQLVSLLACTKCGKRHLESLRKIQVVYKTGFSKPAEFVPA